MAITAKEAARQRKTLRKELERDLKRKDQETLRRLRQVISEARRHKRERLRDIVQVCRVARADNRERAKAIRASARAKANARIERMRTEARGECEARKRSARKQSLDAITQAEKELAEERAFQRTVRLYDKPAAALGSKRTNGRRRAAERQRESDDEVEQNLPAELVPVFRDVRQKIKETPRKTRTEAFLEWAQSHPADVDQILYAQIDRDVEALIKQEAQMRRDLERPRRYSRLSDNELLARHAEAVPF